MKLLFRAFSSWGWIALWVPFWAIANSVAGDLQVIWNHERQTILEPQLEKMKKVTSQERDPKTGETVRWRGPLLMEVIDTALKPASSEQRAQVDLIVVKNAEGKQAFVPRAFVVKYPFLMAKRAGVLHLVPPWSSHPQFNAEGFWLEGFFISGVQEVELTNKRERFSDSFLLRRTDPAALRGERIFVQTCVSCHLSGGPGPAVTGPNALATSWHAKGIDSLKISDRDRRALTSYLDAYRAERGSKKDTKLSP